jgi:Fuc2NAc and GlcNAc transferase
VILEIAGVFFATTLLVGVIRQLALRAQLIDVPNERSSHSTPTPRGGGLAFVITILCAALLAGGVGRLSWPTVLALVVPGAMVAVLGLIDDRRGLPARMRIVVHFIAAAVGLALLMLDRPPATVDARSVGLLVIAVVGVVWMLNLVNFMDGIDGIAASEALFVAAAAGGLVAHAHLESSWPPVLYGYAAACAGFLAWNWQPARIFMGDAGSGFLGLTLGVIGIALALTGELPIATSVILASAFIADATITLLRRVFRGERWYAAHRSHAYQQMSRRFGSHARVVLLLWAVNLGLLLPLAIASVRWPAAGPGLAATTLLLLGALCLAVGAGSEKQH